MQNTSDLSINSKSLKQFTILENVIWKSRQLQRAVDTTQTPPAQCKVSFSLQPKTKRAAVVQPTPATQKLSVRSQKQPWFSQEVEIYAAAPPTLARENQPNQKN